MNNRYYKNKSKTCFTIKQNYKMNNIQKYKHKKS